MDADDDALEHVERLALGVVQRRRGKSSAPTELYAEPNRPEFSLSEGDSSQLGDGLLLLVRLSRRRWLWVGRFFVLTLVLSGGAFGLSFVTFLVTIYVWRSL